MAQAVSSPGLAASRHTSPAGGETLKLLDAVEVAPRSSVTIRRAVNSVSALTLYVCWGFWLVEGAEPSPKSQLQAVGVPAVSVLWSWKSQVSEAQLMLNAATGVDPPADAVTVRVVV